MFHPDERLELIEGEVIQKVSPQNKQHFVCIVRGAKALQAAFGDRYTVRQQGPMIVSDRSEPEPDLMVIPGEEEDYADHPTPGDAALVVEVSDSTLRLDKIRKAAMYARAGVTDYWVVDVNARRVCVYREPRADGYTDVREYGEGEAIAPLGAPGAQIAVSELLPRRAAAQSSRSEEDAR